ncbi:Pet127-domain-containing protein [Ophiobolus disseminans]|uniref:Pet127-domain-containing protein n=1 Tax=Ophiobolus disseminans TaxID=1469910 RepID=A0A6A6ZT15_9PLEO|nr:Pet127-domain-containing protein [Ophiobolus disseminans]
MLRRNLLQASSWHSRPVCLLCAARTQFPPSRVRSFGATHSLHKRKKGARSVKLSPEDGESSVTITKVPFGEPIPDIASPRRVPSSKKGKGAASTAEDEIEQAQDIAKPKRKKKTSDEEGNASTSLKEALLGGEGHTRRQRKKRDEQLPIQTINSDDLNFEAVEVDKPPVPMLSYGLDRVLFNPGVYQLQDPRSRIYNFDPYLEKIMPVSEFDFDALSEYKTSSKDQDLLNLNRRLGTMFTGSTSSMSSVLQHFHYLLSNLRELNHDMLSRGFPDPSKRYSKITLGPDAIFLRYKDGLYAIDADKTYDKPNIMSWLGHSLEKLLTTDRKEFELYRRSSPEKAPAEDNSNRCYHYSKQGNLLMRSQLDAVDPRLPGSGVFDLKTRAVVSIRMNHKEYEAGSGYQLRYAQGEWESFEREFYDMTRATMLKYSLQVRMGRMDGIFLAYHNIERIFGFQYLNLGDMDRVLHGQSDTSLGDAEFKLSIGLLDELLIKATTQFPETTIRLHFETRDAKTPFMYVFAEPVTEEQADEIQNAGEAAQKHFARTVVGVGKDDPEVQEAWQNIQDEVDEQVDEDKEGGVSKERPDEADAEIVSAESDVEEVPGNNVDAQDVTPAVEDTLPTGNKPEEVAAETASAETSAEEVAAETQSAESNAEESASNDVDAQEIPTTAEDTPPTEKKPDGPLMGWTLTARSKVNGSYVDRPRDFSTDDDWVVEYHVQEIPEASRWRLYNAVRERRKGLIGMEDQEADKGLKRYRDLIQRFSNRGRAWRTQQDQITEEMGVHVYRPLGPGSEKEVPVTDSTSAEEAVAMDTQP